MPKISVLMPIWNTHIAHLRAAVDSVLRQTFTDFEFIILNDSPGNKALQAFIRTYHDERIKYYENPESLGVAKSYNRLLDLATAEYAAMMNHDDISLPERLQRQYEYLEAHPEIGLVGTAYKKFGEINRFKVVQNPARHEEIMASLLFKAPVHHPTIMFRRALAVDNNIRYNENFVSLNDRQLYDDFGQITRLANISDVLYKYRFHKDMVSKRLKEVIAEEQKAFHKAWFVKNGIVLTAGEQTAFDTFVTVGRCRIKDERTLTNLKDVLEKLVKENKTRRFMPEPEFSQICAQYLIKRCLNAAFYGRVNSKKLLQNTTLPVHANLWLNVCNLALKWRA